MRYEVEVGGRVRQVTVQRVDGRFIVEVDGVRRDVDAQRVDAHTLSLLIDQRGSAESYEATLVHERISGGLAVLVGGIATSVSVNGRLRAGRSGKSSEDARGGPTKITAPMPGKIVRVLVKVGDPVTERQAIVVIEAMKMENELRAGRSGMVSEIHAEEGQSVDAGSLLAVIVAN